MKDWLRLLQLFKPWRGWLLLGIFLSFITLLANVGLLAISGWFIATMGLAGVAGVSTNYFTPSALIRAMAIIRTAGRYGERLVTHEATLRVLAGVRVWFYEQIEPLAPAGLAQYRSGDLLSRIRSDIDRLDQVYLRVLLPLSVALLAILVFAVVLSYYHPLLALAEVTMLLIAGGLLPWLVLHYGAQTGRQIITTSARLRTSLVSNLQGMGELLVYGAADRYGQEIQSLSTQLAEQQQRQNRLTALAQSGLGLCANLGMWLVLLIAIPLLQQQVIMPADVAMLALFALACFEAVAPMPLAFQALSETNEAIQRIFKLVDQQPLVSEPDNPLPVPEQIDFRFERVRFQYPGEDSHNSAVLDQLSFDLPTGKKLAIIGATGSGKSTITQLLLKFYQADSGAVLLNGQSLQAYSSEALREKIAVVPQQTHLFNQSVRNNLLLAKAEATQDELEVVCQLALVHDTIMSFPEGYDTFTGETGLSLSGGQAKRLVIARALLKPAGVLILDEPTEGLDPENARLLIDNIVAECERRGQSLLLITHRLQQLEQFDEVLVMEPR